MGHIGTYVPIDISADVLHATAIDLRHRYPFLSVEPVVGDFLNPARLPERLSNAPKVGFFPGSALGKLPPDGAQLLLSRVRAWPNVDAFVLGVDLMKDLDVLFQAYDDRAGVTAKFISNILVRLNTELNPTFDLFGFAYEAKWHAALARIEMALISTESQTAMLGDQAILFQAGERVAISQSRKYIAEALGDLASAARWRIGEWITDTENQFAVVVLRPRQGRNM
ncbi:L-histidine N(alpha)-methyltransferase [Tateyamaria sp.]|uniref:L-histidine N(alpha)-methyltransferase n=1 Tax=Tateyamaria sp. TaxID=1929288 RepID=UPI00329E9385